MQFELAVGGFSGAKMEEVDQRRKDETAYLSKSHQHLSIERLV